MRLVKKNTQDDVAVGDIVKLPDGTPVEIEYFGKPHKPASEGFLTASGVEYYVGVVGLIWIEREDRA